jgi:Na+-transporting methylmalonyl-CoA/oxaloacetate decarboxylase gamma subunit
MDSLLDTMANVVGILVVLVAVMQLAVGDAVDRIVEEGVREPATLPQVEALEEDREAVTEAILAARGRLEALPPSPERPGLLLDQAEPLLEILDALPGPEEMVLRNVEKLREALAQEARATVDLEIRLAKEEKRIVRLDSLLAASPAEKRPRVVRLPDPRPPPRGAEEVVFFCRYGQVFFLDRRQMLERLHLGIEHALGESRALTEADRPWLENFFRKQGVEWSNFVWRFDDPGPRTLFAEMVWRDREAGEDVADLRIEGSQLETSVQGKDPARQYIRFWVWPDSFEVYLEARYLAEAAGFDVAWTAVPGEEEIGVDLIGRNRSQVMID